MSADSMSSMEQAEQELALFLEAHIPSDETEYAPAGADEIECSGVVTEHFEAVSAEEAVLLEQMSDIRFVG